MRALQSILQICEIVIQTNSLHEQLELDLVSNTIQKCVIKMYTYVCVCDIDSMQSCVNEM